MEELGNNNPWANDWLCPRQDCLSCQGRLELAKEAEEEAMRILNKEEIDTTKSRKAERNSIPSCTGEGTNYSIECLTCRQEGRRRIYFGETSRSPYQRGSEHQKEVREGVLTHPLVIHSIEEHGGTTQPILMRTLSAHLTPMDRQIQESMNIILETRKEGSCLNQKSEWPG